MAYANKLPGEPEVIQWTEIHRSASDHARAAYQKQYGVDYHADPEYQTGNERHAFWLKAFDTRQESLILNPYQD